MNGQGANPGFWGNLGQSFQQGAQKSGWADPQGNWNWDRTGVTLGQIGQAMAPQGTWQHALSGVGTGMGKSQIAAKAAAEEEEKQKLYNESFMKLAGMGMTDKDQIGGTNLSFGPGGEFTYKGRMDEGAGPFSINQGLVPAPSGIPQQSSLVPQGESREGSQVGDYLANFPASPAGGGVNLAGLTPEEINAIMSQRTSTGQLNLAKAKSLYEMTAPKKGEMIAGKDFHWRINPYTGEAEKTPIPVRHDPTSRAPQLTDLYSPEGVAQKFAYGSQDYINALNKGYTRSNPTDVGQRERFQEDRAKRHSAALMTVGKGDESNEARMAVPELNRTSPDSSTSAWFWEEPSAFKPEIFGYKEGAQKVELPKYGNTQITMGYVRKVMDRFGISARDAIDKIKEANK